MHKKLLRILILTQVLDKTTTNKLPVHQRAMKRKLFGVTLRDSNPSKWIRQEKVEDIIQRVCFLKWIWTVNVVTNTENWNVNATRWRPHGEKGEACEDRNNDLKITAGLNW